MYGSIHRIVCGLALATFALPAQEAEPERPVAPLTLGSAVDQSARNFPAIRASAAAVAAAESGADLARTAYLPRAGVRLGVNRATRNNVFGLIFPNGVLPGISGPVQEELTITSVFGSSAGMLLSYEPFDLGLRKANVRAAEAVAALARAGRAVTEYEVAVAAAGAYFAAVANRLAVSAANAAVGRAEAFHDSVAVLVSSELRPGADASRAKAELARARSVLLRAEQHEQTALASLAEWLGLAGSVVEIDPAALAGEPPPAEPDASEESHPLAAAQQAETAVGEARLEAIRKEWRPRFLAQSAVYGRGTGARIDGTFQGGGHGLIPSEANWAVGFNMEFDLLDYRKNRAERRIAEHRLEQQRASAAVVTQELRGEVARARIAVQSARKIALNAPIELEASTVLEAQARVRYQAGLGTVVEVADAQQLLRQAEVDDSLARLDVWRALFAMAAAQGEIEGLLAVASR